MATGINPFPLQFGTVETYGVGTNPIDITTGDFNGDGFLDLATANNGTDNVSVLLGSGTGTFGTATSIAVGANPYSLTTADFNGDGRLDLAVANRGNNNVSLLLGSGTGTFTPGGTFTVGTQPITVITGDFNGDTRPDLATISANQNLVTILLNNAAGGFGIATNFAIGVNPTSVITADFNADGRLDIVTSNAATNSPSATGVNTITIALGQGDGSFISPANFATGTNPFSLTAGDFNGDGRLDVATANRGSSNISVLLGNGTGGFGTATTVELGTGASEPYTIANRDVNGDGNLDLVTANSSNNLSVLLGNGTGAFTAATPLPLVNRPLPNGLAMGDFNGDGKPDLATANYANGRASVFLNRTSLVSLNDSTKTIDASLERLSSITVDLVAGTLVLNSTPPANATVPNYVNVNGTELGDTIGGSAADNILDGKGGNDIINALSGNDTLAGGAGDDALNGGDGNDRYLLPANTPLGSDTITDSDGTTDTLDFSGSTLPSVIDLGVTVAQTVNTNLTLTLIAANQLENVTGGDGSDRVGGNALNNVLVGGAGDDDMNAQSGDDTLLGEAGNDILVGAAGDDDLSGGIGSDTMRGGIGEDTFIFDIGKAFNQAEMGVDTLRDFKRNIDQIILDRTTFTELGRQVSFASVDRLIQAKRSDAIITYIRGTGNLYYNANGSDRGFGGGGLFAVLEKSNLPSRNLSASDFGVQR